MSSTTAKRHALRSTSKSNIAATMTLADRIVSYQHKSIHTTLPTLQNHFSEETTCTTLPFIVAIPPTLLRHPRTMTPHCCRLKIRRCTLSTNWLRYIENSCFESAPSHSCVARTCFCGTGRHCDSFVFKCFGMFFFCFVVGGGWDRKCCVGSVGGRGVTVLCGGGADLCSGVDREHEGMTTDVGFFSRVLLRVNFWWHYKCSKLIKSTK